MIGLPGANLTAPKDSCGVLLFFRCQAILLCHATGKDHWDLPMGLSESGETPLESAARELKEETGLSFHADRYFDLGRFEFSEEKFIHLFSVFCDIGEVDPTACVCTSMVHVDQTSSFPEVDQFEWVPLGAVRQRVSAKLWSVLNPLLWKELKRRET